MPTIHTRLPRRFVFALFLFCLVTPASGSVREAVVRIEASVAPVDLVEPWSKLPSTPVIGSGVILENGWILTNAHVVQDAISVRVKQEGATRTFNAETLYVQPQVDLAVLRVTDAQFNPDQAFVALGKLPPLESSVQAFGYPEGGQTLSVTAGVVSRVEYAMVTHSLESHLLLQTDAAINGGNSGGPLVVDDRLVGINAQGLDDAENIAYAISVPVIRQFLDDIRDGVVHGTSSLGMLTGRIENPARIRFLGQPQEVEGIVVLATIDGSSVAGVLERGDLITSIDRSRIGRDGTIEGPNGLRIDWNFALVEKQVGDSVVLTYLHRGNEHTTSITVEGNHNLVASGGSEERREYFIFGGALFQPLTTDYLLLFEEGGMPLNLGVPWFDHHPRTKLQRQLVVLNRILAHDVNRGYQDLEDLIVTEVDGQPVRDLSDFANKVENGDGEFVAIEFLTHEQIVFSRSEAKAANEAISEIYGIHSPTQLYHLAR